MKINIAILGATGTVGQKAIKMLENHPLFQVSELVASDKNNGRKFADVCHWREEGEIPERLKNSKLLDYREVTAPYAISSLPAEIALEAEPYLTKKGIHVVSNASAFRRDPLVPLLIPEINSTHLSLLTKQQTAGKLITNPNCSTVFLALGLAPLLSLGEIEQVSVVTLQALSGAGYPGVPSMDILGNIVPNIGGEEEKIEWEINKILGTAEKLNQLAVTAHVNRVPVIHGHTVVMHVTYRNSVSVETVQEMFEKLSLERPELYRFYTESFRPQPLKDITSYDQRAHIGRIKQGANDRTIGLLSMGHNLVRGAAGAAILNLELLHQYLNK